jgi:hypothetical protein
MDQICNDCGAKHWKAELPSDCTLNNIYWMSCCKAGQVKIDLLKEPSAYLKDLFDDNSTRGQNFKKNIRRYNAAFDFTSLKCDTPHINESNMPFQIHGQMYHMQGPLSTDDPSKAKYGQLYIYDPDFATSVRSSNNNKLGDQKLDDTIISNLSSMLHESNRFVML